MRVVKEGTPLPGAYRLTDLGAKMLNSARSRELDGCRATALEKMALTYTRSDGEKARKLMEMNDHDMQLVFDGQRSSLPYVKIEALQKQQGQELSMVRRVLEEL